MLEEVAKFRAARRLWARIMKERFKAKDPRSWMLRFHTQTAGSMLTAQQPDNNIVRVTLQALAAVLGGTQSLHTNSRDEALGLPTEDSVQIALRTQQIIANESGVADVIDPLGGSWAIEAMTDELEGRAEQYIKKIDELGGMVQAISKGYVQREIQDAAYAWQRSVEQKAEIVVGVNAYKAEDPPVTIMKIDPALEAQQVARLKAFRARRDNVAAKQAVDAVRAGAKGTDNLMPLILAAVKAQRHPRRDQRRHAGRLRRVPRDGGTLARAWPTRRRAAPPVPTGPPPKLERPPPRWPLALRPRPRLAAPPGARARRSPPGPAAAWPPAR